VAGLTSVFSFWKRYAGMGKAAQQAVQEAKPDELTRRSYGNTQV
jgi:hypothetical protein